jgi:hypothetical protein
MRKPKTISQLKKELWKHFARYIKNRDNWTCVTCGRKGEGQSMNAGHYIAKAACGLEYYFGEQNVHAQCAFCNLALEGNRPEYRKFILSKYGSYTLDELEHNYRRAYKGDSREWLLDKIKYYESRTDRAEIT